MQTLNDKLQSKFNLLNLRTSAVIHSSPDAMKSEEYEKLWKEFVAVSNEYKPTYTDEEIQAVIDAIDKLLEFLSGK
ncbi:hypothetical protein D3C76_25510 [compost metagenome]